MNSPKKWFIFLFCCIFTLTPMTGVFAAAKQGEPAKKTVEAKEEKKRILPEEEILIKAAQAYQAKNFNEVKKLLQPLADKNNSEACLHLGMMHIRGEGGAKNVEEAERLLSKAAEGGNPQGQYYLGVLYASGEAKNGTDLTKARQSWTQLVSNKALLANPKLYSIYADTATNVAILMIRGEGGSKDESGAFKLLQEVAKKGNYPPTEFILGQLYSEGIGTTQDDKKAFTAFSKSAKAGYPAAQYVVGQHYLQGHAGVKKDLKKAKDWLNKAAKNNYEPAKEALKSIPADSEDAGKTKKNKEKQSKKAVK